MKLMGKNVSVKFCAWLALEVAVVLWLVFAIAGCGGGNSAAPIPVAMVKTLGSLQCSGGGSSLSAIVKQLTDAGVGALSSSCGDDGLPRIALCGVPDGRIAIVEVPSDQTSAAQALGFAPLANFPTAVKAACP